MISPVSDIGAAYFPQVTRVSGDGRSENETSFDKNLQQAKQQDQVSLENGETETNAAESEEKKDVEKHGKKTLTEEEKRDVEKLKQRDQEVRQHEQAHIAAGGAYVRGGAKYQFEQGPDGQRYAVGGEVGIDTSSGRTPEETATKAQAIRRAALAPADPSSQDRRVAAQASSMETAARREIAEELQKAADEAGEKAISASEEAKQDVREVAEEIEPINEPADAAPSDAAEQPGLAAIAARARAARAEGAYKKPSSGLPDTKQAEPISPPRPSGTSMGGTATLDSTL